MSEMKFAISEAAKQLHVEAHVLRYWEEELGLHIDRTEMGHRYYTEDDIQLFRCIKKLKNEGVLLRELKSLIPELTMIRHRKAELNTADSSNESRTDTMQAASESVPGSVPAETPQEMPQTGAPTPGTEETNPETSPQEMPDTISAPAPGVVLGVVPGAVVDASTDAASAEVIEVTRLEQVRSLFGEVITEAITSNNRTLERNISRRVTSNVCREIDLLFQVQEQQEEEHFRKLDNLIRQQQTYRRENAEITPLGALKKLFT